MMSAGLSTAPRLLLLLRLADGAAVSGHQLLMPVRLYPLSHEDGYVLDQLLQRLPRPLLVIVVALPLDQHVDLLVGVDRPLNESLYEKSLNVVLGAQLDGLGHL